MNLKMSARFGMVAVYVLTAGWFVSQLHAEDKAKGNGGLVKKAVAVKKAKPLFYPVLTEREEKIQSALQRRTQVNFPEIPLAEVINYFRELHDVPILIQTKDLTDVGITRDEPITLDIKDLSFKNALLQILDPLDLTFVVEREMILITSKDKAAEMLKTRVYPVGDLCSESPDYITLEDVLRHSNIGKWEPRTKGQINPDADPKSPPAKKEAKERAPSDDEGTITVLPQSKSVVISQTYHAHNAIMELLTQLRQARAAQRGTVDQSL